MTDRSSRRRLPVAAIVPTRNVADRVAETLESVVTNRPAELIVVDGRSTDGTVEIAQRYADVVVDDGGLGVAAARQIAAGMVSAPWIAFIDADVTLPRGAFARLLAEANSRGLDGLQAALKSNGEGDYWSEALATHHNTGRSKEWFGISAALIRSRVSSQHPLDAAFTSGEDVELRLRLEEAGVPLGISRTTVVRHTFRRGFRFAWSQWTADGTGLGRLVRKHGLRAAPYPFAPMLAGAAGILRSIVARPRLVPYFVGFLIGNWLGVTLGLVDRHVRMGRRAGIVTVGGVMLVMWALPILAGGILTGMVLITVGTLVEVAADPLAPAVAGGAIIIALVLLQVVPMAGARAQSVRQQLTGAFVLLGILACGALILRLAGLTGLV